MTSFSKNLAEQLQQLDEEITRPFPNSRKVYVQGSRPDIQVPFREISLSDTKSLQKNEKNAPVLVYDTSGPYTDPDFKPNLNAGLPHLRKKWIEERKARGDKNFSQMHYARKGEITPEMEFVALRENLKPEFVREEVARGRAIIPANINHPELEPMIIGRNFLVKINTKIGIS